MEIDWTILERATADLEAVASQFEGLEQASACVRSIIELLRSLIINRHCFCWNTIPDPGYNWPGSEIVPKSNTPPPKNVTKSVDYNRSGYRIAPRSVGYNRPGSVTKKLSPIKNKIHGNLNDYQKPASIYTESVDYNRSGSRRQSNSVGHKQPGIVKQSLKTIITAPCDVNRKNETKTERSIAYTQLDTKGVLRRTGATDSASKLVLNKKSLRNREPIKIKIKAIKKPGEETTHTYTSTIVSTGKTDQDENDTGTEGILMTKVDKQVNLTRYKAVTATIEQNAQLSLKNFPLFNTGRKPINPADQSRLKKMIHVNMKNPEEYLRLHEEVKNSELRGGTLNVEKMACKSNGKATIVCEDELQKNLLNAVLQDLSFMTAETKIRNFTFSIFGIPKTMKSEDITAELTRRDKSRFKKNHFKIKERFPINKGKDAITISCIEELTNSIIQKPYVFLGVRRYRLNNFVDLVQCYRCSKFGHTQPECKSKKPFCPNCAQAHTLNDCKTSHIPKCGNCALVKVEGPAHSSWDVRCPYRRVWITEQKSWLKQPPL